MAIKSFQDSYQTYKINGQAFNFSPAPVTVNVVPVDAATPVTVYNLAGSLNNVQAVLLLPDVNYVSELNRAGVGGVYTTLQVVPQGSLTGSTVTETVEVGSFA